VIKKAVDPTNDHYETQNSNHPSEDSGEHVSSSVAAGNEEIIAFPCLGLQWRLFRRGAGAEIGGEVAQQG
jgi:hypothetical protein